MADCIVCGDTGRWVNELGIVFECKCGEPKENYAMRYEELKRLEREELRDPVNSPTHYNHNEHGVECIDAIQASMTAVEFRGYLKGNALKYQWRYGYKDKPLEDLKKAQWYLNRLIKEVGDGDE